MFWNSVNWEIENIFIWMMYVMIFLTIHWVILIMLFSEESVTLLNGTYS